MPDPVIISAAVEGTVDEAVVRKLIAHVGGRPGTVRLVEFAKLHWRPEVAARHADSLRRAIDCLRRLTAGARP